MATVIDLQTRKRIDYFFLRIDSRFKNVNLLYITNELRKNGMITEENKEVLLEMHQQNRNVSVEEYIFKLLKMLSFENLYLILDFFGLNVFTVKLMETRYDGLYRHPQKRELHFVKDTHRFYKNLKSQIDNNCLDGASRGVRNVLRKLLEKCDDTIISKHSKLNERQMAIERKAVALVLLMQQYQNPEERKIIINQALHTETNGCDSTSIQIVCSSKLAFTEILRGDIGAAKEYITETFSLCDTISPCFALMSALHDFSLLQKLFLTQEQSKKLMLSDRAMTSGENALLCMFEEQEDVQNMWKRILLQYNVMSLLKMKIDFKVQRNDITVENVARAKILLQEMEKNSKYVEERRKMIMNICHGVVEEMEGNTASALEFHKAALYTSRNGGCFHDNEVRNIEENYENLSDQTSRKCMPN